MWEEAYHGHRKPLVPIPACGNESLLVMPSDSTQIVLSKGTVSIGELFEQKEVFEEVTEMEADDINWDTIVEVLPSGSGEEYEERIK